MKIWHRRQRRYRDAEVIKVAVSQPITKEQQALPKKLTHNQVRHIKRNQAKRSEKITQETRRFDNIAAYGLPRVKMRKRDPKGKNGPVKTHLGRDHGFGPELAEEYKDE